MSKSDNENEGSLLPTPQRKKRIVEATIIDHTYIDHSTYQFANVDISSQLKGSDLKTFPQKLHYILSRPEYRHIISWMPHGRAWKILDKELLVSVVCKEQFNHGKFESFNRQVNGWGFKRLLRNGPDYKCYYNQYFLRGRPDLASLMCRLDKPGKRLPNKFEEPDLYEISRRFPLPELNASSSTSEHRPSDSNSLVAFSLSSSGDQNPPTTFGLDSNKSPDKFGTICLMPSSTTSGAPQTVSRRSSENQVSQAQILSQKESYSLQGGYPIKKGEMTHEETKPARTSDHFYSWESSRFGQGSTEYNGSKDKDKCLAEFRFLAASENRQDRELYSRTNSFNVLERDKVLQEQQYMSSSRPNLKQPRTNKKIPFHPSRCNGMKQFEKPINKHIPYHSFRHHEMKHYPGATAQGSFTYLSEGSTHSGLEHQREKQYQVLQQSAHEHQYHRDSPRHRCEYQGHESNEYYAQSSCGFDNDAPAAVHGSFHHTSEKRIHDPVQHLYEKQHQALNSRVHEYQDNIDARSHSFKDQSYESNEQHVLPSYELDTHAQATPQGSFPNLNDRFMIHPVNRNEKQHQVQKPCIRNTTGRIDTYSDPFEHQIYESHDHYARSSSGLDHQTPASGEMTYHYAEESQQRHQHVQDPRHCIDMHGTEFGHQGYASNEQYTYYDTFGLDHPPHQKYSTYGYQPQVQTLCDGTNPNRSLPFENSFDQRLAVDDGKVVNTLNNPNSLSSSLNDSFLEFEPSPSMFDEK